MLKFSSVLSFVALVATALVLFFAAAAVVDVEARPRGRALSKEYTYEMYAREYGRMQRSAEEHAMRRVLFEKRRDEAIAHNKLGKSWTAGVNQFSDYTDDEIQRMRNKNYWGVSRAQTTKPRRVHKVAGAPQGLPYQIDWTKAGYTTAPKNQGSCGSCWAHSATESMESWAAIQSGQLNVLSQQQVASCTPNPDQCGGTGGCNGATHQLAFEYVTNAGGITEEWQYPYVSYYGTDFACKPPAASAFFASFNGYVQVNRNDAQSTMSALQGGPLSVVVAAVPFLNYDGGVFAGCNYAGNNTDLDHGVQMVGYGYDAGLNQNYWTIRNSWSSDWGEAGHIRLFRAPDGQSEACGWDNTPGDGIACKGDTSPEWICGECGVLYDVTHPIPAPLN